MAVDFRKPAHILAVHGVQIGESSDVKSDQLIRSLVTQTLTDMHVEKSFVARSYLYEDANDHAQKFHQSIARAITAGNPLVGTALASVIDLVGDVVTAARNTSTAHKIRSGLKRKILDAYRARSQLVVVAHSLGTVYALDVINELIGNGHYFKGDDRTTWPVQGFVSMGSPLGLSLQLKGTNIFDLRAINTVRNAEFSLFPWHNYFNRLDPIVSGSVFGEPVLAEGAKGPVEMRYGPAVLGSNWLLQGHAVTSGKQWLMAHTAYWNNPLMGDRLVDMLWG